MGNIPEAESQSEHRVAARHLPAFFPPASDPNDPID